MHADTYIPRRLDDQWKVGFWDLDVAAPVKGFKEVPNAAS